MTGLSVIKIAVADTSVIVRMGVLSALKRVFGGSAAYLEVAQPDDFDTRIVSFAPSVVIVSPSFGGAFDPAAQRGRRGVVPKETKFVALLSQLVPPGLTDGFDAQMTIFDSEDSIMATINSLTGRDTDEPQGDDGENLSSREKQVIRGVVSGKTNKEIADQMNISVYTVLTHRRNIARKLNIHSAIALAIYAISNKLVTVDEVK